MLAKRRSIKINDLEVVQTPLLVPSFSSKGFPDLNKIVRYCSELIDKAALFSAYDFHYEKIKESIDFPSLIFLDSGGYEASKDKELSDFGDREHTPQAWNKDMYRQQVEVWRPSVPSIVISYDHPKEKISIREQIERANETFSSRSDIGKEILLKPEKETQTLLPMHEVIKNIHHLHSFDVIGLTEKEAGNSILDRMKNIATLRRELDRVGLETPIHVFGSMDTVTTPMYFMAGADVFDGLTWLRFAFLDGQTIYKQNYSAIKWGISTKAHIIDVRCWNENYYYIQNMELAMRRYLNAGDPDSFQFHSKMFKSAYENLIEALED
ncbi:hypothetical protein [Nisaea sediminum]|uniref:hypothetical protein n=1 Tax=Nisaea sediminum TaxID=2775867 RepID=UPI001865C37F|nr:hypothetical protein [Nisaea sediminum]